MKFRVLIPAVLMLLASQPGVAQLNPEPDFELIVDGLARPVQVRFPPDGTGRAFIVEQNGLIRIVQSGAVLGTPFLDLTSASSCCGERGLLGMAFHPDYATNGLFFVNYTDNSGDTVVVRYSVSAGNANIADAGSADPIIRIEQDFSNHNAGDLAFGLDGMLYIGMGDGGSGNDPRNRAQTIAPNPANCADDDSCALLGTFIRIDVDSTPTASPEKCGEIENYSIPPDNPFSGNDNICDEVWTYGWRNPFRFTVDRLTGDFFVADVGQNAMEEISFMAAGDNSGRNFEWSCREGTLNNPSGNPCSGPGVQTPPIIPIAQSDGAQFHCSIVSGYRYRGPSIRAQGFYFFSDVCSGAVWYAEDLGGGNWVETQITDEPFGSPVSFGEDELGNLYIVNLSTSNGALYRMFFEDIYDDGFEDPPAP